METMGIAPEAQLVGLKVFDAGGGARFSSIARRWKMPFYWVWTAPICPWAPMPVHTMMRELRNITKQPAMLASTS